MSTFILLKVRLMRNGLPSREKTKKKVVLVGNGSAAPGRRRVTAPKSAVTKSGGAKSSTIKSSAAKSAGAKPSVTDEAPSVNKTRQRILDVATQQFAAKGYDGARVDDIMRLSKVSKNLIYHYFGSKEQLFVAVLEEAYKGMHANQMAWPLDVSSPVDGIRKLVRSTFRYWRDSPEFIGLLNSENFHKGRHLRKSKLSKAGYTGLLGNIAALLKEGESTGDFRSGVDPVELYISISALAYHYLSNRYTLAYLLDRKLSTEDEMNARIAHIEDVTLGYLQFGAPRK